MVRLARWVRLTVKPRRTDQGDEMSRPPSSPEGADAGGAAPARSAGDQRELVPVLEQILQRARAATYADAGSVFVVEGEGAHRHLRFAVAQNDSIDVAVAGLVLPLAETSVVGACALRQTVIAIEDLYRLDRPGQGNNPWSFHHDRSVDDRTGYQTRSMLAVPMISARGETIGVIQLINRRADGVARLVDSGAFERDVVAFSPDDTAVAVALAGQAGLALENTLLYSEVNSLFRGFVQACVKAIEARDPTTSGHSERVAALTVGLAKAATQHTKGRLAEIAFSADMLIELEYAALLHDFGKVGVREHILTKAKKLFPHQLDAVRLKLDLLLRQHEIEALRRGWTQRSAAVAPEAWLAADPSFQAAKAELARVWDAIVAANEPTILPERVADALASLGERQIVLADATTLPLLSLTELGALSVNKGSLTDSERQEINSHVVHTYEFLKIIPWSKALRGVPMLAAAHHEKVGGGGYPLGLAGEAIPVGSRMMAVCDIFDALTASDRPYKKAVPLAKALHILQDEATRNAIDRELLEVFIGQEVWRCLPGGGAA